VSPRVLDRALIYGSAILLAVWVLIPFYIIAVSAFTPQARIFDFPKPLLPTAFSTDTMQFFVEARGVVPSVINSLLVALATIAFGLTLGTPAGYALARFHFRGREAFQVIVLATKMFPIAILSIPLAIASIYGMNFKWMPELELPYGYPTVMAFMFGICGYMFYRFRRAGWL